MRAVKYFVGVFNATVLCSGRACGGVITGRGNEWGFLDFREVYGCAGRSGLFICVVTGVGSVVIAIVIIAVIFIIVVFIAVDLIIVIAIII